jgi:DegV family protein with EDD domain
VETLAASEGEGMLVLYAADLRESGKSIEEVADWVRENRLHLAHWFTVDDLMFLYRGGRVSRASATAGTMLNIKPVMHVDDEGRLIPVSKVRGRKRSINAMFDRMKESIEPSYGLQHIGITHGDCLEDAEYLAGLIRKEFEIKDLTINYVDPVIGAHSGPGTLALFFLAKTRG